MKPTLSILALLALGALVFNTIPRAQAAAPLVKANHRAYDPHFALAEVAFNEARVKRDPGGSIGWRQLASAYLAAGRESDSQVFAKKAEAAAMKSLELRREQNSSASVILSEALMEQHRFPDALKACNESLATEPGNDFAERTLTDIYFELGKYEEARKLIGKHADWNEDPGGLALIARQFELTGRSDEALVTLRKATEIAESHYDYSATTVSWFHIKYGDLLARNGQLAQAEAEYSAGLTLNSGSWKALAGMARLKALQKDPAAVVAFGSKLNAIAPMTDVVGLMEDASRSLGDKAGASRYANQVISMNQAAIDAGTSAVAEGDLRRTHTHDRMFSLYLADHNKMLPLAQHAATHDLAIRKDIYSYDTYAWATYRLAMSPSFIASTTNSHELFLEAKQSIDKALAFGTHNALIYYHAAKIEQGLGQMNSCKDHIAMANKINPSVVNYLEQH